MSAAFARGHDLLQGSIDGDAATRTEFVEQYTGLIRFAIVRVLRQRGLAIQKEEVDDLTHAMIVSLFERDCHKLKLYEGRNQASLATFVRICTTRFVLDHIRHQKRRPIHLAFESDPASVGRLADTADPRPGPEASAATSEDIERLFRAVADLPSREQLLVRLHFAEGLDVGETARILGLTENATYVLKSRVKKKLREHLRLEIDGHE